MKVPIEDYFEDILAKAARGLVLTTSQIADRTGLSRDAIGKALRGEFNEDHVRLMAGPLNLDAEALVVAGRKTWYPEEVEVEGLALFNTQYGDMTVNAFVVWDPATGEAGIFDTGAEAEAMLAFIRRKNLTVKTLFITHIHGDHIAAVDQVVATYSCPVYVGEGEGASFGQSFSAGKVFSLGSLEVESRLTRGHARGGISYVVRGLKRPLAIVGDALFAQSMGGGMVSYQAALETNRKALFTLPDDTVVCPGHGPMTSIGEEKRVNPFFPEFKV